MVLEKTNKEKVYCKKDYLVYETDYKKGSIYSAYFEDDNHIWIQVEKLNRGCRFYFDNKNSSIYGTIKDFNEHFMSLKEARKEKLKKLLK